MATDKQWPGIERRKTQRDVVGEPRRRRLRDRLETEEGVTLSPTIGRQPELKNPMLLCDDDLRQSARALEGLEAFLLRAVRTLEKHDLTPAEVAALLDEDVDGQLDALGGTLESLRRSLRTIAGGL